MATEKKYKFNEKLLKQRTKLGTLRAKEATAAAKKSKKQ